MSVSNEDFFDLTRQLLASGEFAEIEPGPSVEINLRYASTNNFTAKNLYGSFNRALLHKDAYRGFLAAVETLRARAGDHRFIVFDALRPRSVQRLLWAEVVGTPNQIYLANPDKGSLHNFGFAVDLSILGPDGQELDMGAGFDDFREIAHPAKEAEYLAKGELTHAHVENRDLLRAVMRAGGFKPLPHEWWHFDFLSRSEAEARFRIVE